MKKSFIYTYLDGTKETVEYDDAICTEETARTIYHNLDKFCFAREKRDMETIKEKGE